MTRRERLSSTIRGLPVDRPPVSFYEIDGLQDQNDPSPFNIYSDPSWRPVLELAREKTDRMARTSMRFKSMDAPNRLDELTSVETREDADCINRTVTIRAGSRTLTSRTRRDAGIDTVWTTEHLLKDADDLRAWIDLPDPPPPGEPDARPCLELDESIGDSGIILIDVGSPLCAVASLFDMGEYTVMAMTERGLFRKALDKAARSIYPLVEAFARAVPGKLWRLVGSEYAAPPYLPPSLFEEYVTGYDRPIVEAVQKHGGFVRAHSHGNLKAVLDHLAATGCVGLDPVEPPPQGDVTLRYVRERHGAQMALFGNLEASDLETLPTPEFEKKIAVALDEGTAGEGRGFVLMPSACPYGRQLSSLARANYEKMVEMADRF